MKKSFYSFFLGVLSLLLCFAATTHLKAQANKEKPGVAVYSSFGKEVAPAVENYQFVAKMAREHSDKAVPEPISYTLRNAVWTEVLNVDVVHIQSQKLVADTYGSRYSFAPNLQPQYNSNFAGRAPNWSFTQSQTSWTHLRLPSRSLGRI
jgi:hypothetical protein